MLPSPAGFCWGDCVARAGRPLSSALFFSFERQASNWQEEFLLWKAPRGLGSSFRNLCGYSLEANKKERNKEVGIPRAEILDMQWGCAKEQNGRGGEMPARASQICPQESVRIMVY